MRYFSGGQEAGRARATQNGDFSKERVVGLVGKWIWPPISWMILDHFCLSGVNCLEKKEMRVEEKKRWTRSVRAFSTETIFVVGMFWAICYFFVEIYIYICICINYLYLFVTCPSISNCSIAARVGNRYEQTASCPNYAIT